MDPLDAPNKRAPERRSALAAVLGVLTGLIGGFAVGLSVVFGGLMSALPNGSGTPCHNGVLLTAGFAVATILVAAGAWYVLLRTRTALGWWPTFARAATVIMAIILLAPWPCGFTGAAGISFMACRQGPAAGR